MEIFHIGYKWHMNLGRLCAILIESENDSLVQLGLMWRRVEPGVDIGHDRHINLNSLVGSIFLNQASHKEVHNVRVCDL